MDSKLIRPTAYHLGKFNTVSNTVVDIHEPTVEMINPEDIACGLSNICRWGGQLNQFYSVAQHCVLASRMAPPELKQAALLHDAAEAYLGDCISPLKHVLGATYKDIEHKFEQVIFERFNVDFSLLKEVKSIDTELLCLEHDSFRKGQIKGWDAIMFIYFDSHIQNIWSPSFARKMYINEMERLFKPEVLNG